MKFGTIRRTMFMASYLRFDVVLVSYPFSDLTATKIRPAVIVNGTHISQDLFIIPLTSKTGNLLAGEFVLSAWKMAGLNVETAVKRGIYTVKETLVRKRVGKLRNADAKQIDQSCVAG